MHAHNHHPELDFNPVESSFIRAYISQARQLDPYVRSLLRRGLARFLFFLTFTDISWFLSVFSVLSLVQVPVDLTNFIVQSYVDMRARDADSARDAGVRLWRGCCRERGCLFGGSSGEHVC